MAAIQVKNVPEDLHSRLRERAGGENLTLGAYILRVLEREVAKPQTLDEWLEKHGRDEPLVKGDFDSVALIRAGRDERDQEIAQSLGDRFLGDRRATDV